MTVLILERVKPGLRGELSRWFLEVKAGVFVGTVSAMVRERLWSRICNEAEERYGCLLVHNAANEQGFRIRSYGIPSRQIVDFDGLQLVRIPTDS
ncbi:type I-E CRISPR-associated endoribonuclease Cas2e [Carboxydochorda subterranea]|uniref:Type I-E CRISPR-associated endoribonuclease Cas2e n=1 Tax=Carboxydichorda subterranea TaxID=3109565 RepID=A0ABZ1BUN5_9FIRM|nr:type I-E CRISPR-associated endoribonuclease Cas2e [Limnochorda sp. L945t]WRP16335.1 type I-E CRISPR-associated endoribonuclease Cas2e [Limnochorda sp. L945t]